MGHQMYLRTVHLENFLKFDFRPYSALNLVAETEGRRLKTFIFGHWYTTVTLVTSPKQPLSTILLTMAIQAVEFLNGGTKSERFLPKKIIEF